MAKEKISGIYKITSKHNGKVYIGQSNDIYRRWKSHWKQVAKGDKDYIHNAMRKYGKENFEYEIIERCNQDVINEREIYWIEYFDSYKNGYNLTTGGEGVKGKKYSLEEKENMREYAKNNNISKPVLQFDTNGILIKEWRSCSEIGRTTNMLSTNIHDCITHKDGYRLAYGYIWVYKDEYDKLGLNIEPYLSINKEISYYKIFQINNQNKIVKVWNNIYEILDANKKYKKSSIYASCNDNIKTAYNYVWTYENNYDINFDYSIKFIKNRTYKTIYQFKKNGVFINKYNSLIEAENLTGIGKTAISQCARHELKTAGGFIWLFEAEIENINEYVKALKPKEKKTYQKNLSLPQYKRINLVDNKHNIIKTYNTASEAAKELKLSSGRIHEVCRKKYVHTKGYMFEYAS